MKRKLQNTIGVIAVVLLVALTGVVFLKGEEPEPEINTTSTSGSIIFEKEELVFDGSETLDLMQGVKAKDSNGSDATEKLEAFITGDSLLDRKTVRYTFVDSTGRTVTDKRTLVMKNYDGPSLYVKESLTLDAQDLKDLITVLENKGWLAADDGYGKNITSSVKCLREKKAENQYEMKLSVVNDYQDSDEITVNVRIEGDVPDPEITLSATEVTVGKTEYFDAKKYIVYSSDGYSENVTDKIEIDSSVNTSQSGDYRVTYRLYSADKTAVTTKVLKVKVEL